jgi:hypothetical protein
MMEELCQNNARIEEMKLRLTQKRNKSLKVVTEKTVTPPSQQASAGEIAASATMIMR